MAGQGSRTGHTLSERRDLRHLFSAASVGPGLPLEADSGRHRDDLWLYLWAGEGSLDFHVTFVLREPKDISDG